MVTSVVTFIASVAASKMHFLGVQQWPHSHVSGRVLVYSKHKGEHGLDTWPCSALPQIFKKLKMSSFCIFHTLDASWTIF